MTDGRTGHTRKRTRELSDAKTGGLKAYSRFDDLRDLMQTKSGLNLDAEIDRLESELQALFSEAQRLTSALTPSESQWEPAYR